MNWIFTTIVGFGFPWMKDNYSLQSTFMFFIACSIIGLLYDVFLVKESKGKD